MNEKSMDMVGLLISGLPCRVSGERPQKSASVSLFTGTDHFLLRRTMQSIARVGIYTWLLLFLEQSKQKWLGIIPFIMPTFTPSLFLICYLTLSFHRSCLSLSQKNWFLQRINPLALLGVGKEIQAPNCSIYKLPINPVFGLFPFPHLQQHLVPLIPELSSD